MRLKEAAGWNQTECDWRRYLILEPAGCYLALYDGQPAGTVTTVSYGTRLGWIGMVLVHPELRRRGIGTALMRRAIEYLKSRGVVTIALDATAEGRPVYERLGFLDDYGVVRLSGTAPALTGTDQSPRPFDIEAVCRFDAAVFGADRSRVIRQLAAEHPARFFVAESAGTVSGYIAARPGTYAWNIGPWVSADTATAEWLFRQVLGTIAGSPAVVDVPLPQTAGQQLCARFGFAVSRQFTRMYLGEKPTPIDTAGVFSGAGAEKG